MAANLTNDINSADKNKLSHCIDETRRMGIEVDPPSVNYSSALFTVVDGRIVYGFVGIKGLGDASAAEIVRGRKDCPYKSFIDFLERVDIKAVGKKVIELLIQTGAFDEFGVTRETLVGNLENTVEYALKRKEDKMLGQSNLFEDLSDVESPDFKYVEYPQKSREEKLNTEKQLIGFYFSGHPMDEYKEIWQKAVKVDLGQDDLETGACILVGIIKNIRPITTSKGAKMAFASLADYNGEIDVVFFTGAWEKYMNEIEADKIIILKGKIDYQKDKDRYSFIVDSILGKQDVDNEIPVEEIHIRLNNAAADSEENLFPLRDYLAENSGSCSMFIHVPVTNGEKTIRIHSGINFTGNVNVIDELKSNKCVAEVWRK
jgi:DNA polymerase-3 subunit alpha